MALPLFDEPAAVVEFVPFVRLALDSPEYFVFWKCFREGREGQSYTFRDEDEGLVAYAKDGYRIGRLFRPLPIGAVGA